MIRSLALVVFGLTTAACAVGIEDPQPPPTPEPEQQQRPPARTFSARLVDNPVRSAESNALDDSTLDLPPKQKPPVSGTNGAAKDENAGGAGAGAGAY